MAKTIYEKMWDEELPSYTLYRNEAEGLLAILDIHPATPGHTLIIPREPVERWDLLPDRRSDQMHRLGSYVGRRMIDILTPLSVSREIVGNQVPHVHEHIYPLYTRKDVHGLRRPGREHEGIDDKALKGACAVLAFPLELSEEVDEVLATV